MNRPKELTDWDFPNTIQVPDGYYMTEIPDLTRANMNFLIDEHNKLVEVINVLCEKLNIEFDDDKQHESD